MNAKKCKAVRKVLFPKDWHPNKVEYQCISHPVKLKDSLGNVYVEYRMQYVSKGMRRQYKLAKKIYKLTGMLPRADISV